MDTNTMKQMVRVLSQTEAVAIQKQDGSTNNKSTIVLQEVGGKYEDSFVCALLGNQVKFYPNDIVYASLRFSHREYNGNSYQDVTIQDIIKINK